MGFLQDEDFATQPSEIPTGFRCFNGKIIERSSTDFPAKKNLWWLGDTEHPNFGNFCEKKYVKCWYNEDRMGIWWFGGAWKIGYTGIPMIHGHVIGEMMMNRWTRGCSWKPYVQTHQICTGLLEFHVEVWKWKIAISILERRITENSKIAGTHGPFQNGRPFRIGTSWTIVGVPSCRNMGISRTILLGGSLRLVSGLHPQFQPG